jgi:hypothetical protein
MSSHTFLKSCSEVVILCPIPVVGVWLGCHGLDRECYRFEIPPEDRRTVECNWNFPSMLSVIM